MTSRLINLGLYQIGWFCCVLGAARGQGTAGGLVALALVLVHVALLEDRSGEAPLLALAGGFGLAVDSTLGSLKLLDYASPSPWSPLAPVWIVALWIQLATLLRFGLAVMVGRPGLAALLGAAGGPLAFMIGERLGAVRFAEPAWIALLALGVLWAIALALLSAAAARLLGPAPPARYRCPARG
ncbi:MAG: DUF2878 domain-containing protein [Acidobacteria bacterium]|nr:MAG: DUF2878 domain-containing protein [Acidobacteriota bacterium]